MHQIYRRALIGFVMLLGASAPAAAQDDMQSVFEALPVDAFDYLPTFSNTSVFNYLSTYGVSALRDVDTLTGTATLDLEGGFLSCETGTTAGSECLVETVEFGRYEAGREGRWGVGIMPTTLPTGDGVVEWGAYDGSDGAFFRIHDGDGDGLLELCVIYEADGTETETCGLEQDGDGIIRQTATPFNGGPRPQDFDPFTDAGVYVGHMNWYGIGGTTFIVYYPVRGSRHSLKTWYVHVHAPATGQSFIDPNQPIRVRADNGTTTDNVEVQIGGRRYDIAGAGDPERRINGHYRIGQTVTASGNPLTPLVCVQREATFPGSRVNTVPIWIFEISVDSDQDLILWFVINATLTGASFVDPPQQADAESAAVFDVSATAITASEATSGPYYIEGGANFFRDVVAQQERSLKIFLTDTEPVCVAAIVPGAADATVDTVLRVIEGW